MLGVNDVWDVMALVAGSLFGLQIVRAFKDSRK